MNTHFDHFAGMGLIMIVSGLLSTMNVWVDKLDDMRLSMNDIYMISLMTGWMFLFMGLWMSYPRGSLLGLLLVLVSIYGIRTQLFVSQTQFLLGMIPHHSMAIHMSRQLETKPNSINPLLEAIRQSQEIEIKYMKLRLLNG